MTEKKYGSLHCMEVEGAGAQAPLTVLLLHGFGADSKDLAGLINLISAPPGTRWLFPNGLLSVPIGPYFEGRAWWPIRMADLEQAAIKGAELDFSKIVPPGIRAARDAIHEFMQAAGLTPSKTVIGGFSQGAMLATDIALRSKDNFRGLIILSGSLVCVDQWLELAKSKSGLRYVQSHGSGDTVLPISGAERLRSEVLLPNGLQGEFIRFRGGHEIPPEVCSGIGSFLFTLL